MKVVSGDDQMVEEDPDQVLVAAQQSEVEALGRELRVVGHL